MIKILVEYFSSGIMDMDDQNKILPSFSERLVLLVKNPGKIFVFWRWNKAKTENFLNKDFKKDIILKFYYAQERSFACQKILSWNKFKEYVDIPQKGKNYYAVMHAQTSSGKDIQLLESNIISVPGTESAEVTNTYASGFFKKESV
ncbi:MAG: DUF4912 domain-containing protein [Elusimicrobia bacterium]|nr:DUF4912 domain-containing protein [Elusimicrobiota bacterium]